MKRKLLLAMLCIVGALGMRAQSWIPSEVGEGGYALLYNVGTEQYLTRGNGWGTQASIGGEGSAMTVALEKVGDKYKIRTTSSYGLECLSGRVVYTDQSRNKTSTWTFTEVDATNHIYNIISADNHGDGSGNYLTAEGGSSTVVGPGSDGTSANAKWKVLLHADRPAALLEAMQNATTEAPVDVTRFIKDANFGAFSDIALQCWSVTASNKNLNGGRLTNPCGETFQNNGGKIYQEIHDVPNGTYLVKCQGFGDIRSGSTPSYLYANDEAPVVLKAFNANGEGHTASMDGASDAFTGGYYENEIQVTVTGKSLTIGVEGQAGNWTCFDNFRLFYLGPLDLSEYIAAYETALTNANTAAAKTDPCQTSLKTPLTDAISTYSDVDETDQEALAQATSVLVGATNAVNNSITAYANAKAYLDEAETILAGTNVYTAAAYATYYTEPKAKYEEGTLTTDEAKALVKTSTGWHSANTIDDILLSAWTFGGELCRDYEKSLYINTWSVEGNSDGSEFLTPFFEYWTGDGNSLDAKNLVATMTGLKASTTYSFTIRARVRQTDNQTKIANGITMKVGDGEAVDISSGNIFKTGPFYIGNFSAVGETDADGKLTCTITVAENSNISWLSFYNCKVTEGEDLSAYIADYEFALNTATDCKNSTTYAVITGKERTDLEDDITTYATVDETDKAALIAAKNALEGATAAFTGAAATYTAFAELNKNVASTLGVNLPTITATTTAADLDIESYIVDEYKAAQSNYGQDFTDKLGGWTNAPGTNKGESWNGTTGDGADTYYDEYNKEDRAMTQTITLPAGEYALIAKGRASAYASLTLTDGTETVKFAHKSSTGRGIATDGTATFADDATYANNGNGRGWEYRVLTFSSDGETPITLTFDWKTSGSQWAGLDDIELRANPAAKMIVKANKWGTFIAPFDVEIPAGINAYKVTGVDDNGYMVKTAVETTIPANTPVVLENTTSTDFNETFNGKSTATADSYTVGALTGVYTASEIPVSIEAVKTYVLQTQNDVQAFYIVNDPTAAFTATPNRCYLTVKASTEAAPRAIFIEDGDATGIKGVDGQIAKGKVKGIYSANGTELNQLQKGLNIVKMADGKVQKVYVK
ncbi:MAG: hypothetical protein IJP75_05530 [Bacteroidaceae bacterium]|nr:hypothetical protein [Bacteroidaceae bacterium]